MTEHRRPMFDLKSTFDTTLEIGLDQLPIHIKRLARAEMEAFEKQWGLFFMPRGPMPTLDADQTAQRETAIRKFAEDALVEYLTLDEGLIRDNGAWVTDGRGFIAVFHARTDVLTDALFAIWSQNRLIGTIRKNLNSPRASVTGSPASVPTHGGGKQGPTAESAVSSSSVSDARVTAENADDKESPSLSGAIPESEEPIVH